MHNALCGTDYDGCAWKRDDVARVDETVPAYDCHGVLLSRRVHSRLSIHSVRSGNRLLRMVGKRVRFSLHYEVARHIPSACALMVLTSFIFPRSFTSDNLPRVAYPKGFHGNQIPIDGAAVAKVCLARLQS